jgi:hypothetical protein
VTVQPATRTDSTQRRAKELDMNTTGVRLTSVWAAVALSLVAAVGVAQASPPTPASATFTQTAPTGFDIRVAGPNLIVEQTTVGSVSGDWSGTFEDRLSLVIHPNGMFTAQNRITCACTVDGRSGDLELLVANSGEPDSQGVPTFAGSAVITGATGELSGLGGVFDVAGTVDLSGLSTTNLSGQIHFHP